MDTKTVVFIKEEGFYTVEYPMNYNDWESVVTNNPGTLRIEDMFGGILWEKK